MYYQLWNIVLKSTLDLVNVEWFGRIIPILNATKFVAVQSQCHGKKGACWKGGIHEMLVTSGEARSLPRKFTS
ncbi:hypothetical protein VT84_15775 [Gemmata sp. SH-PL17]|nr:hypothetical protein VT84_15775 [Gemmata sp. SH-PL17]